MERPLPDAVARPVRAYLATLVPPQERSDAWHELAADVAYWGEGDLLAVLRLAHQVVLQHERVTPEVAALALADIGVDDPGDVAVVLDADVATARRWVEAARASAEGDQDADPSRATGRFPDRPRTAATVTPSPPPSQPAAPVQAAPDAPSEAVRIGFDEDDGPLPHLDGSTSRTASTRAAAWLGLGVLAVLVVVWVLLR